jgi:hypothetical protein
MDIQNPRATLSSENKESEDSPGSSNERAGLWERLKELLEDDRDNEGSLG